MILFVTLLLFTSDQAFSAEAEKCLEGLERHLGVSGCLLRREAASSPLRMRSASSPPSTRRDCSEESNEDAQRRGWP